MTKQRISKFQPGSGVFTCRGCGKRTRASGYDRAAAQCGLCERCYDRATWANGHSDGSCYECNEDGHEAGACPYCDMEQKNARRLADAFKAAAETLVDVDHGEVPLVVYRSGTPVNRTFAAFWSHSYLHSREGRTTPMDGIMITDHNRESILADAALPWVQLRDRYPDMVKVDAQALQ